MRIGILGGGQLAMMMVESTKKKYDIEFLVVDPTQNPPASKFTKCLQSEYDNTKTLDIIAKECDLVTIDFENVPANALRYLENKIKVFPNPDALEICQDRLKEKNLFKELNIPTTNFKSISSKEDLESYLKNYNQQYILKSRKFGYDGKNQIRGVSQSLDKIWNEIKETPYIIENLVDFSNEASLIGVRTQDKKLFFYPLTWNNHRNGILRESMSFNNEINETKYQELQKNAENILTKIMEKFNYIGVLVIEFFVDKDFNLIANEMAPRVHNSGHWTIEGANISQFESHIRSISDINMEKIKINGFAFMINLIGNIDRYKPGIMLLGKNTYFHDYGKSERKNRKLGHVTVIDNSSNKTLEKIKKYHNEFVKPRLYENELI
ncbi:MAG: 5-(carboxyamino)imidazole ribonucleotide synthase [Gammaproteobacteria bacterium]|nr:5-(carboxyamino)imidazole ribonucleotide synthase [Gammaproteobacteria bacterium]